MVENLVVLLAGFVLTSIAGGFLGYRFQQRAWQEQERVRLLQSEREAARTFFEELSRVFDRRLHRMRELDSRLARSADPQEVQRSLDRYRTAVDEWNDNLNRMLALAQRYFGQEMRDRLDYGLMTRFVKAGQRLEVRVREHRADGETSSTSIGNELDAIASEVYILNVRLIEAIQRGTVGVFHPDVDSGQVQNGGRRARQRV
jgi:type II secretory pathway pseudopilin PulG